jgi:hypothetical protein
LVLNNIKGTKVIVEKLMPDKTDPTKAPAVVARIFLFGRASDTTRAALEKLAFEPIAPTDKMPEALPAVASQWATHAKPADAPVMVQAQLIALALGSPEFQRK